MPQNMAVLRHRALNMLRQEPSKGRLKMKRFRAAVEQYRTVESYEKNTRAGGLGQLSHESVPVSICV